MFEFTLLIVYSFTKQVNGKFVWSFTHTDNEIDRFMDGVQYWNHNKINGLI